MQVMEDEINELRKKLIEKDRDYERLQVEQSLTKGKSKIGTIKNKSLDTPLSDSQNVDLKRQLQVVEQEANVLRTKTQTLEQENEKLLAEIKKLQLQVARNAIKPSSTVVTKDSDKTKIEELEKERDELKAKIKKVIEDSADKLPARTPKVFSDTKTKLQLKVKLIFIQIVKLYELIPFQRMIEELEDEVIEMRTIAVRSGAGQMKTLEEEIKKLKAELNDLKNQNDELSRESSELKS